MSDISPQNSPPLHSLYKKFHLKFMSPDSHHRLIIGPLTNSITYTVLFFPQLAHGASIPSDRSKLQKRGGDNAIGLSGLVATIIGVLITAIGVFGWKCWRGRWNVTKNEDVGSRDQTAEVELGSIPPLVQPSLHNQLPQAQSPNESVATPGAPSSTMTPVHINNNGGNIYVYSPPQSPTSQLLQSVATFDVDQGDNGRLSFALPSTRLIPLLPSSDKTEPLRAAGNQQPHREPDQ